MSIPALGWFIVRIIWTLVLFFSPLSQSSFIFFYYGKICLSFYRVFAICYAARFQVSCYRAARFVRVSCIYIYIFNILSGLSCTGVLHVYFPIYIERPFLYGCPAFIFLIYWAARPVRVSSTFIFRYIERPVLVSCTFIFRYIERPVPSWCPARLFSDILSGPSCTGVLHVYFPIYIERPDLYGCPAFLFFQNIERPDFFRCPAFIFFNILSGTGLGVRVPCFFEQLFLA